MTDLKALATARELLAETEAKATAGEGGPYVQQNLESHRRRVARLEAQGAPLVQPPVAVAAVASQRPVAVAVPKKPASPTGTREERLARLAGAWKADETLLATAIAEGTTPDAFAVQLAERREAESIAAAIIAAGCKGVKK